MPSVIFLIKEVMVDARHAPMGIFQVSYLLGLRVMNSLSDLIEYQTTVNSLDLHSSIGIPNVAFSRNCVPDQMEFRGTDIAQISRKQSKPDNHGHENGIESTRAGRMLSKDNKSQP
ncbi:hypothetical protein Tco_1037287 [Tanacetum coccineum]